MAGALGLHERVALAGFAADYTHAAAVGLLGALALLAFCLTSFRALLLGGVHGYGEWLLRLLLVIGLLGAYDTVVGALLDASQALSDLFAEHAGWDEYWQRVGRELQPFFAQSETSAWDRLVGLVKGDILTIVVSVSYYLEFMVFELVRQLTATFAALLYVLGPLMIVGGLIGRGASLAQWFKALVQVALWPSVPPFLMLVIIGTGANAIETGNTSYIIAQNIILLFLGLLTPAVVMFVFGSGGISLFAAGAVALGSRAVGSTARIVRERYSGGGAGAYAAAAAAAAGSPGPGPGPGAQPRADDRPRLPVGGASVGGAV